VIAPQHFPERPAWSRHVPAAQLLAGLGTNTISFLNAAGSDIEDGATGLSSPHAAPATAIDVSTTARIKRVIARSPCSRMTGRAGASYANPALWVLAALMLLTAAAVAAAQTTDRVYRSNPADEDWSFLKEAPKADIWDPAKYVRLGRDDRFMTVSGEVRFRPEGFRIRPSAERPAVVDNYLLQRYLFGVDTHFGPRTRVFAEIQSGIIDGRLRSPRPTDQNTLDVHQAFVEWRRPLQAGRLFSVKVGRQELVLGSTRLISASPGLNVKRSFDGAVVSYRAASWTLSGAVARLVALTRGTFNDGWTSGQLFWGVAAGRRSPRFERGELGAYYLGLDRSLSTYAQGIGPEQRHTLGMKWNGSGARLSLNYDGLFQWGSFGGAPIRAWAFATETGYQATTRGWRPRLGLRMDLATGDRNAADPRLEAFNPLFPGNSYSGAVGLFGPTNLTDLTPTLTLRPLRNVTLVAEAPSYWRTSSADGVYAADLRLLFRPDAGEGRYVGTNPGVLVDWQATRHCQLQAAITRFLPGAFVKNTFVSPGFGFYSASAVYRF